MTRPPPRPTRPAATAPAVALACLVAMMAAGLVWMHALGDGHHLAAGALTVHLAVPVDPCTDPGSSGHCPDHRHPGQVCQPLPASAGISIAAPAPTGQLVAAARPRPMHVSAATAAGEAGAGTGCGPPSLSMLSISRT